MGFLLYLLFRFSGIEIADICRTYDENVIPFVIKNCLASAPAITLPIVSRAEDLPPPDSAFIPYFLRQVRSAWPGLGIFLSSEQSLFFTFQLATIKHKGLPNVNQFYNPLMQETKSFYYREVVTFDWPGLLLFSYFWMKPRSTLKLLGNPQTTQPTSTFILRQTWSMRLTKCHHSVEPTKQTHLFIIRLQLIYQILKINQLLLFLKINIHKMSLLI